MNKLNIALSLNGKWMLAADPDDRGLREQWFQEGPPDSAMEAEVPGFRDERLLDYSGAAWYFKSFSLDDIWTGRPVSLNFDAVDSAVRVWVNGMCAGEQEGDCTPFCLNITELVCPGENRLAVRVVGKNGPRAEVGLCGDLCGEVTLESTVHRHLSRMFVLPDLNRGSVHVFAEGAVEPGMEVRVSIEGTPFVAVGKPGPISPVRLDFPDFKPWSLEQPKLYRLRAELLGPDGPVHAKTVRFGMRSFTVKENRFFLNNRPLHVKAVLHQPDPLRLSAGSEGRERVRRDIQLAKEAGFNMLRLRQWPAPGALLEMADEMGILIFQDIAVDRDCGPLVLSMVGRDRNHPSVVAWGVYNRIENAGEASVQDDMCLLVSSQDPTRPILSGVGAARMLRPGSQEFQEVDAPRISQGGPVDLDIENYFRHIGDPAMLVTVSASGCGDEAAPNGEAAMEAAAPGFAERGLDRLFGDLPGMTRAMEEIQCDAARMQLDALRANPKVAGYCHGRLTDGRGGFPAGVTDREGREKPVLRALAEAQQPLRPVIQIPETNLSPRQEVPVTVLLANEGRVEGQGELSLQLTGPTGQMLWKKRRALPKIPKHGRALWEGSISASGSCGPHRFTVRLLRNGQIAASADADLYVVEPAPPRELTVHLLDPHGEWTGRFGGLAAEGNLLAPVHVIPPLANTIRAYPDNDLAQVLAQVRGGAVAVFFGPPDDWNDLAALMAGGADLAATSRNTVDAPVPAVHYAKVHPVFDKLPSRGLMRQPYRNVAPAKTFAETGEEDICGTFTPGGDDCWGTGILVRRYGAGRLVFTHLRLLEHLGADPVADRVFSNLAAHLTRRSVPPDQPLPPDQRLVEWMRRERLHTLRRWMVIGEFPNWNRGAGFHTAYPPETAQDFDAVYPGWYRAVRWSRWHSSATAGHLVDLQTAFSPVFSTAPKDDRAVGYAYAEFVGERRQGARMVLGVRNAMKVWLNGELVFESDRQVPGGLTDTETVEVRVRQGKNTLLVKCAKVPGPFGFSLDLERSGTAPLAIQWWR